MVGRVCLLIRTMLAAAALAVASQSPAAENLLQNPGFEPPAQEGLAHGWLPNVWGDCDTVFSLDGSNAHSGQTSQRIECLRRVTGASQFLQPLEVVAGSRYVVRLWVRAEGDVPFVGAALRHNPSPYTRHLGGTFEPGREWELFELQGLALESDDNAGLYIWFEAAGSGTVWVDDAEVLALGPGAVSGPSPEGNVIEGGSFEVPLAHRWDLRGDARSVADPGAPDGRRALRIDLVAGETARLTTPCMQFNGGNEALTLALSARAQGGPAEVRARLRWAVRAGQSEEAHELRFTPGERWERFAATREVAPSLNGAYYLTVDAAAEAPATVWIDALSLSPAGAEYAPAAPVEAALTADAFAGVFAPEEPKRVRLHLYAARALDEEITVRVRDYLERTVAQVTVPTRLDAGESLVREIALPLRGMGAFRADAYLAGRADPVASMVLSVVPRPKDVPPQRSVIGGHFGIHSPWQLRVARRLGYRWTRIHDASKITHWRTVEPEPGQWQFFDEQVDRARDAGLMILGEFLRVPQWAMAEDAPADAIARGAGPYRDEREFQEYVRTVVRHYRGRIDHWEIWNEPYHSGFYGGDAEDYAQMVRAASEAAREANPRCTLLAPCISPNLPEWVDVTIAAGALDPVDIFSYHGYGCKAASKYALVQDWVRRNGRVMEHWNTETGLSADSLYRFTPDLLEDSYTRWLRAGPVEESVHDTIRYFALSMAAGSERFFYYWNNVEAGMLPRLGSMSIYEWDRTIRPHGVAYAIAAWLLDPCEGAGIEPYDSGVTACYLRTDDRFVAVVWADSKLSSGHYEIDLPEGAQVLDVMGNPLSRAEAQDVTKSPMYVMVDRMLTTDLRRALREAFER